MGLFDWAGDAWDGVTHAASDAWDGVTHAASDAWNGLSDAAGWLGDRFVDLGHFVVDHWKTIAAVAVGTIAFIAVATFAPELLPGLFVLAPDLAPWLVLGGAGFASGSATRLFDDIVDGRSPGWDVLTSGALSGVFTVVTAGTLSWLAPKVADAIPALEPWAQRIVIAGRDAADGAGSVDPIIKIPEPDAPIAPPVTGPVTETLPPIAGAPTSNRFLTPGQAAWRAPKTRGIVGLLAGEGNNHHNNKMDAREQKDDDAGD